MAQLGRVDLEALSLQELPDNTNNLIEPINHRKVVSDLIDSTFNLVDDNFETVLDASGNTITEVVINELIVAQGTVVIGDVGGVSQGATLPSTGDFTGASVILSTNFDSGIEIYGNFGTENYQPIITVVSLSDGDDDNDIICVARNTTASSFQVFFREVSSNTQNIKILVTLLKFEI